MGWEKTVVNELEQHCDVLDVYFDRGVLHVINGYDLEAVSGYMQANWPSVKVVADEDYLTLAFTQDHTVFS